jgi:predicted transposase YdaD
MGVAIKKEHHFADYLMRFEMIYSHFSQNQTTLSLSDVQNKFAPLSFYVCHTNILDFEAFLSSEI